MVYRGRRPNRPLYFSSCAKNDPLRGPAAKEQRRLRMEPRSGRHLQTALSISGFVPSAKRALKTRSHTLTPI